MHIGAAVSKNTGCGHRRSERVWEGTAAKRATLDADTMRSRAQIKTMTSDTRAETPRWWCCCSHPCLLGRSTPTHPHLLHRGDLQTGAEGRVIELLHGRSPRPCVHMYTPSAVSSKRGEKLLAKVKAN
jgi:hypothetical protein